MSVLGELNELLNRIPVWRELITLPRRVKALEERLGMAGAAPADERPTCRYCRTGKLDLVDSKPHRTFGEVGVNVDTLKCDNPACGKTEEREHERLQRS
jgi:hypothetical protein